MSRTDGQDEILSVLVSLSHPLNEDGSLEAMTSRRCCNSEEFCLISKTSLLRDSFSAVSFREEVHVSFREEVHVLSFEATYVPTMYACVQPSCSVPAHTFQYLTCS